MWEDRWTCVGFLPSVRGVHAPMWIVGSTILAKPGFGLLLLWTLPLALAMTVLLEHSVGDAGFEVNIMEGLVFDRGAVEELEIVDDGLDAAGGDVDCVQAKAKAGAEYERVVVKRVVDGGFATRAEGYFDGFLFIRVIHFKFSLVKILGKCAPRVVSEGDSRRCQIVQ